MIQNTPKIITGFTKLQNPAHKIPLPTSQNYFAGLNYFNIIYTNLHFGLTQIRNGAQKVHYWYHKFILRGSQNFITWVT
jgi:hypothetical protein